MPRIVLCSKTLHEQQIVHNKETNLVSKRRTFLTLFNLHTRMDKQTQKIVTQYAKALIGGTLSINDISDKEFSGKMLTPKEKAALSNFEKYRLAKLNAVTDDMAFHEMYRQLQVMANLAAYTEFLKDEYIYF